MLYRPRLQYLCIIARIRRKENPIYGFKPLVYCAQYTCNRIQNGHLPLLSDYYLLTSTKRDTLSTDYHIHV